MHKKMVHIIGGGKTGLNLYLYFRSHEIPVELYFFHKEYAEKKNEGKSFQENWPGMSSLDEGDLSIVSSETGFVHLIEADRGFFQTHYFLRDKLNLNEISEQIKTSYIEDSDLTAVNFPLAVKPKESSSGKVPFKFKKVDNPEELLKLQELLDFCIVQPFLSDDLHSQLAVAGYFDGNPTSLIAVQQKCHYPKGISAYVVNQTAAYRSLINNISAYLNKLGYRGFIEFEFKINNQTSDLYLMDINPRPWGWIYYYLSGLTNVKEVIQNHDSVHLEMKPAWVNLLRLAIANLKGSYVRPSVDDIFKRRICYEPMF